MKKLKILSLLCLLVATTYAQTPLTLEQAIDIALQNNFDIKIAQNTEQIARNNARPGNAGMLPTVNLTSGANYSNADNTQTFASDAIPKVDTIITAKGLNASVGMKYRLFDGMGSINTLKKLNKLEEAGEIQTRIQIENIVVQVVSAYYLAAQNQQNKEIILENISVSNDRLQLTNYKYEYGTANKVDVLSAEVDLASDSVDLRNLELALEQSKRNLTELLGGAIAEDVALEDKVTFNTVDQVITLIDESLEYNSTIESINKNIEVNTIDIKAAKSGWYPTLDGTMSYGYNQNKNSAGFILETTNLTYNAGLSLNFNIFDGLVTKTKVQNAKLTLVNTQIQKEQLALNIENQVKNAYSAYQNSLAILNFEDKNLETAELNLERTEEAYRLGQVNSTQFRDAQLNLARAKLNMNSSRFSAKLAEVELMRISGRLLKVEENE